MFYLMANVIFFVYVRLPITIQMSVSENETCKSIENENYNNVRVINIDEGIFIFKIIKVIV